MGTFLTSLFAGVVFLYAMPAVAEPSLVQKQGLSLDVAKLMLDGCEKKAAAEGWAPVSIAIIDDSGNLLTFVRQDGAVKGTIGYAQLKAGTAASFGIASGELGDKFEFADPDRPVGVAFVEGITVTPGGLPIYAANGQLLGGIGTSGASSDEDVACSQAGINAAGELLK